MKKSLFCALLNLLLVAGALAQSPYRLNFGQEAAWYGGAGAGLGLSFALHNRNHPFTESQLEALDVHRVPMFDRFATRYYGGPARRASDWLLYASMALPLSLLADPAIRSHTGETGVLLGEVFMLNGALTALTKELAHRTRPFTYNPDAPQVDRLHRDARMSFFSGHTSTAAALSFGTAKVWSDYHPALSWAPAVWFTAAAIPAAVGFFRVKGGKHFPSDVLVGFAVGAATGWLIPHFHRR